MDKMSSADIFVIVIGNDNIIANSGVFVKRVFSSYHSI